MTSQSPAGHARKALSSLAAKLAAARVEEGLCADRLASIESDLALNRIRLEEAASSETQLPAHTSILLRQRVADLMEVRSSLIAERARRRREIDEMTQRQEAIDAALAVLRARTEPRLAAT
ncbi:MAG: hypothetical protein U5J99_05915 [Parvularculaceae bacterium]|nr:hypothetical protein [Parvularculaceae bacterium]